MDKNVNRLNIDEINYDEVDLQIRRQQRQQRISEMKRRKKQQERIRKLAIPIAAVALVIILGIAFSINKSDKNDANNNIVNEDITNKDDINNTVVQNENKEQPETIEEVNAQVNKENANNENVNNENSNEESTNNKEEPQLNPVLKTDNTSAVGNTLILLQNNVFEEKKDVIEAINRYKPLEAVPTNATTSFSGEVVSTNGLIIDVEEEKILAQKDSDVKMSPASMTKILTLLVASENVENLDDKFTVTIDITDYSYVNDCSNTGFEVDEVVTVRDLMYGTILPSGADAALGLAIYVAGSHEAFVDMMNEKLDELGLSDTAHFTNCVGLYDKNHYCTMYDMAVIIKAAADNEICREIMSAKTYTTSITPQHPEGITISNWFLRRIEDKDTHGEVLYAKTGFVAESGSCAASYARGNDGKEYICVTANSTSSWRCIYDHVELYQRFLK